MLTILGVFVVLLSPVLVLIAMLLAAEARQRARTRAIDRQVRLTDAIHAELGAVVAPRVDKRAFGPWRVTFSITRACADQVGRLLAITDRVLGHDLEIVFTRAA